MLKIVLLQLFWASFALIGSALLLFCRQYFSKFRKSIFYKIFGSLHFLIQTLVLLFVGLGFFALPITLAYILQLPVELIAIFYILALVASLVVISLNQKLLRAIAKEKINSLTAGDVAIGAFVFAALTLSYIISLRVGSPIDNDTPIHLSKIQLILNRGHYTLKDAFVGYNGIIDLRYSTNLMDGLQVIVSHVINYPAYLVWKYSDAFFKLVVWLSIFSLSWVYLPNKVRQSWPYIILAISPFIYTQYYFLYAILPHEIILAWICLLFIGFKYLVEKGSSLLLILAALLIAETHVLVAAISLAFLILLTICVLFAPKAKFSKQRYMALSVAGLILFVPVLSDLLSPSTVSGVTALAQSSTQNIAIGLDSLLLAVTNWHGFIIPDIPKFLRLNRALFYYNKDYILLIFVLAFYVFVIGKRTGKKVKLFLIVLLSLIGVAIFNVYLLSLAGYVYLVREAKNRLTKIFIILAAIYFVFVAFNPVVLTAANLANQPLWIISRFEDFNVFSYISAFIGLLWLFSLLVEKWGYPKLSSGYILVPIFLIVGNFSHSNFPLRLSYIKTMDSNDYASVHNEYSKLANYSKLTPYLSNQVLVTNDTNLTQMIPLVMKGNYVGYLNYQLANPAQDSDLRTACQVSIFRNNFDLNDLEAAHITRVVLINPGNRSGMMKGYATYVYETIYEDGPANTLIAEAKSRPYLRLLFHNNLDYIFQVNGHSKGQHKSLNCHIPYGQ